MRIEFQKSFDKRYAKLTPKLKEKIDGAIKKFKRDPFDPILKNHSLKGSMIGKRSFSVTGDMRVIFEEHENYTLVLMLDVGTHNQVY